MLDCRNRIAARLERQFWQRFAYADSWAIGKETWENSRWTEHGNRDGRIFCAAGEAVTWTANQTGARGDSHENKLSLSTAPEQSDKHKLWDKSCQTMGNLLALVSYWQQQFELRIWSANWAAFSALSSPSVARVNASLNAQFNLRPMQPRTGNRNGNEL